MPRFTTFNFESEDGEAHIQLMRANGQMGVERATRMYDATQAFGDKRALYVLCITYANAISCVVRAEGKVTVGMPDGTEKVIDLAQWPIPFEDFALLPDEMIQDWEAKVYLLNPHWNPSGRVEESIVEKKEPS